MLRDPAAADLSTPGRLEALAARWSATRGPSVALSDARGDWTWRDLEHGRKQLAELLLTLGVRAGDRVMVVGENCAPLIALFAAVASVHAWFVPMDARRSPRSLDAIRAHASPRRVLFLADDSGHARDHAQRVKAMRISLGRWGTLSVSALDERCVPEPYEGNAARDVAALAYRHDDCDPRAVMLTHANLAFVARVMAEVRGIGPDDRLEVSIPVSRCEGLALCLAGLGAGAKLALASRPDTRGDARDTKASYGLA
ncbi:MAG TPA: class I adenylate-forming enzyme family protein, partial [Usitatibacter sp.]|nr:class I adenylate-forming enzyme family protein [Usitatibacter sp.]